MSQLVHYTRCPVCNSAGISKIISANDHTVTNEKFDIFHCTNCQLRFTQDVPGEDLIGKYYKSENYISHTNTSKGIINRIYQLIRSRAIRQKRKLIEHITGIKKGNLLDIGSGTGYFAAEMYHAGWNVTGLEPDADARKIAEDINKIELLPIENLFQLPAGKFDAISLWHVLEHVHDLKNYMLQIKKLLNVHGKLFVAVPNYTSYDAQVYKEYWAAYDVPRHLYHFSPNAMKELMQAAGLEIIDMKPMWYDSFYVSLLSSRYKNARLKNKVGQGSTNWIGAFVTAFISNMKAIGNIKKCSSVIYIISPKKSENKLY